MNELKILKISDKLFSALTLIVVFLWVFYDASLEIVIFTLLASHHFSTMTKLEEIKNQEVKVNIYKESKSEVKLKEEKEEKIYSWGKDND